MVESYLPVLVILTLGTVVGVAFATLNRVLGPSRPSEVKSAPYECGLPSDVQRGFRFGISFYLVAMLFILFDIETIFLYPVAVHLKAAGTEGSNPEERVAGPNLNPTARLRTRTATPTTR